MNIQSLNGTLASYAGAHPWLIVVIIWAAVWKMIALWKAARNNHLTMFVIIAILNTAGILEICYLIWLYYRNKKKENLPEQKN